MSPPIYLLLLAHVARLGAVLAEAHQIVPGAVGSMPGCECQGFALHALLGHAAPLSLDEYIAEIERHLAEGPSDFAKANRGVLLDIARAVFAIPEAELNTEAGCELVQKLIDSKEYKKALAANDCIGPNLLDRPEATRRPEKTEG